VPLGSSHDRAGFACGVDSLDRDLKAQAGQDIGRKANAVFVLSLETEPERVLGYYTLCAMAISLAEVPEAAWKHIPRYPLVSCTLIGRLAVAKARRDSDSVRSHFPTRCSAHSRAPAPSGLQW